MCTNPAVWELHVPFPGGAMPSATSLSAAFRALPDRGSSRGWMHDWCDQGWTRITSTLGTLVEGNARAKLQASCPQPLLPWLRQPSWQATLNSARERHLAKAYLYLTWAPPKKILMSAAPADSAALLRPSPLPRLYLV